MYLNYILKDILEDKVDERYYLSEKMLDYITQQGTKDFSVNNSKINCSVARPLTTEQNKRAGTTNYISNDLPNDIDLLKLKTNGGGLLIKNATKQGYLEANVGDGIDISTRMETHRGTVQKGTSQTLTCQGGNNVGVVVNEKDKT